MSFSDDDRCDLDPSKICNNCFRCLEPDAQQDYARIEISAVYTDEDYIVEETAEGGYDSTIGSRKRVVHVHTLTGCRSEKRCF